MQKEYKQNHNTIEPAPLGIEPNMICIETQQTCRPFGQETLLVISRKIAGRSRGLG